MTTQMAHTCLNVAYGAFPILFCVFYLSTGHGVFYEYRTNDHEEQYEVMIDSLSTCGTAAKHMHEAEVDLERGSTQFLQAPLFLAGKLARFV